MFLIQKLICNYYVFAVLEHLSISLISSSHEFLLGHLKLESFLCYLNPRDYELLTY